MKLRILAAAVAAIASGAVHANSEALEEVTIIGDKEQARLLAGTGSVIDDDQHD